MHVVEKNTGDAVGSDGLETRRMSEKAGENSVFCTSHAIAQLDLTAPGQRRVDF